MTTPTIVSSLVQSHNANGFTCPATVNAGDLLIYAGCSGGGAPTLPSGWTEVYSVDLASGAYDYAYVIKKVASGTEANSNVSLGAAIYGIGVCLAISGAHGDVSAAAALLNGSFRSDPPSVTASWGSDTNLWIAVAWNSVSASYTGDPTGFTNLVNATYTRSAYRAVSSATLDPGTFAGSGVNAHWVGMTVAIRPALPVTATPLFFGSNF